MIRKSTAPSLHPVVGQLVSVAAAVSLALAVALASLSSAFAYQTFGGKWSAITNLQICVSTSYGNDSYRWLDSLYWWNITSTDFGYTTTCSSNVISLLDANYSGVGWDGLTQMSPSFSSNPYSTGWGYLNYYYIQGYNPYKANSVSVHEMGHLLGLAHETGCVSMVDNTYDRYEVCGIVSPTQDDIDGVNYLY